MVVICIRRSFHLEAAPMLWGLQSVGHCSKIELSED